MSGKRSTAHAAWYKTMFFSFVACMVLPVTISAQAYYMGDSAMISINNQLKYLFSNTGYTDPDVRLLYDHVGHFVDEHYWGHYDDSTTINPYLWTTIYEEMWWSQFDTNDYERIDEFYEHVNQHFGDTADIGFMRMTYYKLLDSALYDSTYYFYDSVNNYFVDNANRTAEPYEQKRMFVGTSFKQYVSGYKTVFRIAPDNIVTDSITDLLQSHADGPYYRLFIDFADGDGWQEIEPDSVNLLTVTYDTAGDMSLRGAVVNDTSGDTIDMTQFVITVTSGGTVVEEPGFVDSTSYPGMDVGFYSSCDTTGQGLPGEKYIIYLEGFDFLKQLSIRDNYEHVFKYTNLAELRNHGYNIVIMDWKKPGEGIEDNAMRFKDYLDDLRCQLSVGDMDTLHQFVVIGESMGGVIARYALTWMEANANQLSCRQDLMHNTRLFISLDAPQDGAYIPMSFQEMYSHATKFTFLPFYFSNELRNRYDILRCDAAQDMLKLHQLTNPGNVLPNPNIVDAVYSATSRRDQLEQDLNTLNPATGGYPEHCKLMAISNGLMTGEHQVDMLGAEAQPGESYISGSGNQGVRVFGITYTIMGVDIRLNSLDGSTNDFFRFQQGRKYFKLVIPTVDIIIGICPLCIKKKVPWGLPTLQFDYATNKEYARFSTTAEPWDVMPGGYYDVASYVDDLPPNGFNPFMPPLTFDSVGLLGPGVQVAYDAFSNLWGTEVTLMSQLNRFNFIPAQSALDYTIPGQPAPLDRDIYTENITTKLSRTPFDVIAGEVNGMPGFPQSDAILSLPRNNRSLWKFPARNRKHTRIFNHRRNDSLINSDTSLYTNPLYAFYLNREIGEEELLLENFDLNRTALFEAEYIIKAGTRLNPYYEYPGQAAQEIFMPYDATGFDPNPNPFGYNLNNNAIFSKEATFNVSTATDPNATAVLKADSIIDVTINGGMTGNHLDVFAPQWVCVLDFWCFPDSNCSEKRGPEVPGEHPKDDEIDYLALYPNPVSSSGTFSIATRGRYFDRIGISDLQGRTVMQERLSNAYETLHISASHLGLGPGVYIVSLRDGITGDVATLKLVVQ